MLGFDVGLVVSVFESVEAVGAGCYNLFDAVFVEGFHVLFSEEFKQSFFTHAVDFASAAVLLVAQYPIVQSSFFEASCEAFGYVLDSWIVG